MTNYDICKVFFYKYIFKIGLFYCRVTIIYASACYLQFKISKEFYRRDNTCIETNDIKEIVFSISANKF